MARAQVVVLRDDWILLVRHRRGQEKFWLLPGGAIEVSEAPEAAAIREVREETGLEIALDHLLFMEGPRNAPGVVIRRPRYTYLGHVVGGMLTRVTEPDRGNGRGHLDGAAWMPFELPEYDPATCETLSRVREAIGNQLNSKRL